MIAYTDYPFDFLADIEHRPAPLRKIEVLSYDGDKYCKIKINGIETEIKSGYIYQKKGRYGEVLAITRKQLDKIGPAKNLETIKTICYLCNAKITIIIGRSNICPNCKTNLAFIYRNYHDPTRKINNMKLRIAALTKIKINSKIGPTEALRQAIKDCKEK